MEREIRLTARANYHRFIEEFADFKPAQHHRLLIDKLQDVADGKIKRLMVFMPPGSAKSTYANMYFAPWWLGKYPDKNIITASYGQELADKFGRRSRNLVASREYRRLFNLELSPYSSAAARWELETGGSYFAVGVGGPVTGQRSDLAIIDDPVKGREEAESELIRDKVRDWYKDDLWTRLKPGAAIVLIMTRWHEEDLAGWLLEEQEKGGEQWEVLSLPMIAEDDDALGREPGTRLWADWFTDEMVTEARRDARRWSALYQQRPVPEEGDYFKIEWFREYVRLPPKETLRFYGASDYAVTDGGGDYTVHIVVALDPADNMYVVDIWRKQVGSDEWVESQCDLIREWKPLAWATETGQINAGIGPFLRKRMRETKAFTVIETFPTRGDKATRAQSIRGRMAFDGLFLLKGAEYASVLIRECLSFPAGKHDDQVDTLGLIGQLLDHMLRGRKKKRTEGPTWEFQSKDGTVMLGNISVKGYVEKKERQRRNA